MSAYSAPSDVVETPPTGITLIQAKDWLRARVEKGARCPCCTQFAKIYRRPIHSGQAWGLIKFYRHVGGTEEWAHVPSLLDLSRLGGDWAKLARWGLIEEATEPRADGGRAGWWRLTPAGLAFVRGDLRVRKYMDTYDNRILDRADASGEMTTILDALGTKFDYEKLMKGEA